MESYVLFYRGEVVMFWLNVLSMILSQPPVEAKPVIIHKVTNTAPAVDYHTAAERAEDAAFDRIMARALANTEALYKE